LSPTGRDGGSRRKRGVIPGKRSAPPRSLQWKPPRWLGIVLLCLVVLFFALIRVRLLKIPLERDEGEYAYAGQLILQGIPPYKLVYNMKLPGTYGAYALFLLLFGQSTTGIHLGLLLMNAATTVMMFVLAKRLFGQLAGVAAAASFALLSTGARILGLQAHATHFVVFAAVAGLILLHRAAAAGRWYVLFLSGVMFGLAFLMKQPGLLFSVFAGIYLFYEQWREKQHWRKQVIRAGSLALGVVLPFALTCLVLFAAGVFHKFRFWVFNYAFAYANVVSLSEGIQNFADNVTRIIGPALGVWCLAGIGLSAFAWDRTIRKHMVFVLGLLLFSFAAVCPGLYFRPHYFILMLPAVSLLVGVGVSSATRLLSSGRFAAPLAAVPTLLLLAAFGYAISEQSAFYFEMDPNTASRWLYPTDIFPEAVPIADYIREHSPSSATVAVLGSEPEIYFYANRHSATGYIYTFFLLEKQQFAKDMQEEMLKEIEAAKPDFLLVDQRLWLHLGSIGMDERLAWINRYVRDYNYRIIADLAITVGGNSHLRWGDALEYRDDADFYVLRKY